MTAVASANMSRVDPLALVEANMSRLSASTGERRDSFSLDDLLGGPRTSSPRRTSANDRGTQQPARAAPVSDSEQAFLADNNIEGGATEDGSQAEEVPSDHEADDLLDLSVHEQSREEDKQLDSSLESLTTIGSLAERQSDQSFGDQDSEPEDDPSEGHGQGDTSATRSPSENVVDGANKVDPPLDAASELLFIPEELKGEIEFGLPNDIFNRDLGEWKVPKQPWCMKSGSRWTFWIKSVGRTIKPSSRLLMEKLVNGKTLVALTDEGKTVPMLREAFEKLPDPQKPCIRDMEERQWRRKTMMRFLATENSSCNAAIGDWDVDKEKEGTITVGKLPLVLKELADGDRPARQVSPPPSFTFSGTAGSEAQGFHEAVYGDAKHLTDYLG